MSPPPSRRPRFSILIPTYNRQELLALTIGSVLAQTFSDYELIVIDDGSTDGTVAMLESYGSRLTLLRQTNQGPEAARSLGCAHATGDYLVLLDSDDLLYPAALATYARLIGALAEPPVLLGAVKQFHGRGGLPDAPAGSEAIEYIPFRDYLSRDVPVSLTCSQLVIKRSVALAAGVLRPSATSFPFDIPDMLLLAGTSGPFIILRHPCTVGYRQHETNTVKRIDYMLASVSCLARFEKRGDYPGGGDRRFDRSACIGTMTLYWMATALKHHRYRIAGRLLGAAGPMMLAGLLKRLVRNFRPATPLQRLPG